MIVKKERLQALDVFRGMTIAGMILVNTPGSWSYVYPPLRHAQWHGFTPTDLVFPFFLFAVGAAMSFSLNKYSTGSAVSIKIIRRTFLIFLIGVLLNLFPFYNADLSTFRIMGVLQRIALAYGIGAFLCYFSTTRYLYLLSIIILLGYWVTLWLFGTGDPYSLEGNAVLKLDLLILGADHMWGGQGIPFDPEGLLSTLPSAVNVIIGFLVGKSIQASDNKHILLNKLYITGTLMIFSAMVWDIYFPINKPIWTSSYVLITSGIAIIIISFFIYFIDIKGMKAWIQPFLVFGTNPLIIYALSIVWVKVYFRIPTEDGTAYGWIYQNIFVPIGGNMMGSLLFALAHVVVLWMIGMVLYRKNILIKI